MLEKFGVAPAFQIFLSREMNTLASVYDKFLEMSNCIANLSKSINKSMDVSIRKRLINQKSNHRNILCTFQ